jgi:hypothetical protein
MNKTGVNALLLNKTGVNALLLNKTGVNALLRVCTPMAEGAVREAVQCSFESSQTHQIRAVTHQVRRPVCLTGEAGSFPARRAI